MSVSAADWVVTYREVLSRLAGFRDHGNARGRAGCPLHGDGPSGANLWVAVGDRGSLTLRCYPRKSGVPACTTDMILRAIGLDFSYLYPDNPTVKGKKTMAAQNQNGKNKERASVESIHSYQDQRPDGEWFVSYEVVKKRYTSGKKEYPQRRPNPDFDPDQQPSQSNQEYLYDVAGKVRKVLYGLRQLRTALSEQADRWVFLVEGEKDVETLWEMGFTATCSSGGAVKWDQPHYAEELKGCNIVVIPDEDPLQPPGGQFGMPKEKWSSPGLEHAKQTIRAVLPVAKAVRLMRMPEPQAVGWDFSDWRRRQTGSVDDVRKRVQAMVRGAVTVTADFDLDSLKPVFPDAEPQPASPAPAQAPASTQPPAVATPQPVEPTQPPASQPAGTPAQPDEPKRPASGCPASVREVLMTMDALKKAGHSPRSLAEWIGDVWIAAGRFQALIGKLPESSRELREQGVLTAAHILRGLDTLGELTGK